MASYLHRRVKEATGNTEYMADDTQTMIAYTSIPSLKTTVTTRQNSEPTVTAGGTYAGVGASGGTMVIESQRATSMYEKTLEGTGPVWEVETVVAHSGVTSI